jgi:hypothetical protein
LPNVVRNVKGDEMNEECSTHEGRKKNAYKVVVRNSQGRMHLGRTRHRWQKSIRTDQREREREWECMDWIYLDQNIDQC